MLVFLKLLSESLLSFYPAMVKYIQFPIINQMFARFIIYTIISLFFIDFHIITKYILSPFGISLALANTIHVYSSYLGFSNLESGVSYSIFYIYPLIILLLSNVKFKITYLFPIIGVLLLTHSNCKNIQNKQQFIKGTIGIIFAIITEVIIYFLIKNAKYNNQWNSLFISYIIPTIILTITLNKNIIPSNYQNNYQSNKNILILLIANAIIGAIGYYLRFYVIGKMNSGIYSVLTYFGIVMAYVYGWILNQEKISIQKIIGSLIIVSSCLFI